MLREICLLATGAAMTFAWLSATVAPIARTTRAMLSRRDAAAAWALALGAAVLWTIALVGVTFVFLSADRRLASAVLVSGPTVRDGLLFGAALWFAMGLLRRGVPRFGDDVEIASALAVVALVKDDPATLARVEAMYRRDAIPGAHATVQSVQVVHVAL